MKRTAMLITALFMICLSAAAFAAPAEKPQSRTDQIMDEISRSIGEYALEIQKEAGGSFSSFMNSLNWEGLSASTGSFTERLGGLFSAAIDEMKKEVERAIVKGLQDAANDLRGKSLWQSGLASVLDSAVKSLTEPETSKHEVQEATLPAPSPKEAPRSSRSSSGTAIKPDKLIPQSD